MSTVSETMRLLRTVRFLRPSQLYWRLRYTAQRRWEARHVRGVERRTRRAMPARPEPSGEDLSAVPLHRAHALGGSTRAAELRDGKLTLLAKTRPFRGGADWRMTGDRRLDRLWIYTLHYHEWLLDLAAEPERELLRHVLVDWLDHCDLGAPGFAELPWNSYTIATRIEWWIRLHDALPASFWSASPGLRERFFESLAAQASYLHAHLEWDLRGNHLMRDARGLAWAARFFTGEHSRRWAATAADLVRGQSEEQLLADGGHFERSPMYHIQVMDDLSVAAVLLPDPGAGAARRAWARMAGFLRWVRHPDGEIPLLNDAAFGAVPAPDEMLARHATLGFEVDTSSPRGGVHFPDTGVVVWQGDEWSLFYDVGPLGPDDQPGHGHADTLTVECSIRGRRLFVDPGTVAYDRDERRRYDRSTAAHNTVCVDEQSSSEVWHIFRVGRRARARVDEVSVSSTGVVAAASHDGYRCLPGRPVHRRRVTVDGARLGIIDSVDGTGEHRLSGGFLLEPAWRVEADAGGWELTAGSQRVTVRVSGAPGLRLLTERRPYHPAFGVEIETCRLTWDLSAGLPVEVRVEVEAHR